MANKPCDENQKFSVLKIIKQGVLVFLHCDSSIADMKAIDWNSVKPTNNPTIARMLTVSTGVFTAIDIGKAIATQKYWVSINYVGIGRFAVAIGSDVSWGLKARNVKKVRAVYENMKGYRYKYRYVPTNGKSTEKTMDMFPRS